MRIEVQYIELTVDKNTKDYFIFEIIKLMNFENKLEIGKGIYSVPDLAAILNFPYKKVNTWLNEYWDGKLGKTYKRQYSWRIDNTRAVSFHTLVEFYVMMQFSEAGVKPAQVLKAHQELTEKYKISFPFAKKQIIENISTDGKKIYINVEGSPLTLDGTKQFNLEFIRLFFKKLDFDKELLAARLWPIGRDKAIVCDPKHKFGQPVIVGTNIQTDAIYKLHLANEPDSFIASLYEISVKKVIDAIDFHRNAA